MEDIYFKPSEKTPEIDFNFSKGEFLIRGISIPENTVDFYHGLIFSIQQYAKIPKEKTVVKLAYEYFNTSTSAIILKLIKAVEEIESGEVSIIWYYEKDDFEMQEVGLDFQQMTSVSFELVEVADLY